MCKWVWFNKQASPVVVELPVERVGEGLGLKAASLQEESTLELAAIEELVNSARLAHLKEKRNTFWQKQAGPPPPPGWSTAIGPRAPRSCTEDWTVASAVASLPPPSEGCPRLGS